MMNPGKPPNMTEKMLTGTHSLNPNKQTMVNAKVDNQNCLNFQNLLLLLNGGEKIFSQCHFCVFCFGFRNFTSLIFFIIYHSVIFFTFLGMVPVPVQLGKIALFFLPIGKKVLFSPKIGKIPSSIRNWI